MTIYDKIKWGTYCWRRLDNRNIRSFVSTRESAGHLENKLYLTVLYTHNMFSTVLSFARVEYFGLETVAPIADDQQLAASIVVQKQFYNFLPPHNNNQPQTSPQFLKSKVERQNSQGRLHICLLLSLSVKHKQTYFQHMHLIH